MDRASRAVGAAVILAAMMACGRSPTTPAPQSLFAGTWLGQLRQVSCTHPDVTTCDGTYPPTSTFTLLLVLEHEGSAVSGTFDLEMLPPPGSPIRPRHDTGTLTGQLQTADSLALMGSTFAGGERVFEVRDWQARLSGGALTGRFILIEERSGAAEPLVLEFEMLGLIRIAR